MDRSNTTTMVAVVIAVDVVVFIRWGGRTRHRQAPGGVVGAYLRSSGTNQDDEVGECDSWTTVTK